MGERFARFAIAESVRDFEVAEVPARIGSDPEGDRALYRSQFEVMHNQARLVRMVDVECRHVLHHAPHMRLFAYPHICV